MNLRQKFNSMRHLSIQAKHSKLRTTVAESKTLVKDVLEAAGKINGVPGIAIIAFAASRLQDRVEKMKKIPKDVLDILESLKLLGESILHANLRDGDKMLQEGLFLICMSVVWSEKCLQSGSLSRFGSVNITAYDIEGLKSDVFQLREKLSMAIGIEGLQTVRSIRRIATLPLQDYKLTLPAHAVGIQKAVDKVLGLLEVGTGLVENGVKAILLYGIGGIGKTTLANAVCSQIATADRHFAKVEVGENPTLSKICKIQSQILERLCGSRQHIGDFEEGQILLRKHFATHEGDRFVLFIDNVFEAKDLNMLLSNTLDALSAGSCLIVTSRSRQAMDSLDVCSKAEYPVGVLDYDAARELFIRHIKTYPLEMEEEISRIVELCGGLPLALELVGCYLRNQVKRGREGSWVDVTNNLKKCRVSSKGKEDKLNEIVSWSYMKVSKGAQTLFVDICSFVQEKTMPVEYVEDVAPGFGGALLEELEDYSLVKITKAAEDDEFNGAFGDMTHVHDVLASFGKSMASSHTRILVEDQTMLEAFLQDNILKYEAAEGFFVEVEEVDGISCRSIPAKYLDVMHKSLRALSLESGVYIDGTCEKTPEELRVLNLQFSGEGGPGRAMYTFPFKNVSGLQQLRFLSLQNCSIPCIGDTQFPENLKFLWLDNVKELQEFRPDAFEKCGSSLQTLCIEKCENLVGLPRLWSSSAGNGNCLALRALQVQECKSLKALPDCLSKFQKLEQLGVYDCPQFESIPRGLGEVQALRLLTFEGCRRLKDLPSDIGDISQLDRLDLKDCNSLESLPESISQLKNLTALHIYGCPRLQQCLVLEKIRKSGKVEITE